MIEEFDIRESRLYQIAQKIPFYDTDITTGEKDEVIKDIISKNVGFDTELEVDDKIVFIRFISLTQSAYYTFKCVNPWVSDFDIDLHLDEVVEKLLERYNDSVVHTHEKTNQLHVAIYRILSTCILNIYKNDSRDLNADILAGYIFAIVPHAKQICVSAIQLPHDTSEETKIRVNRIVVLS